MPEGDASILEAVERIRALPRRPPKTVSHCMRLWGKGQKGTGVRRTEKGKKRIDWWDRGVLKGRLFKAGLW